MDCGWDAVQSSPTGQVKIRYQSTGTNFVMNICVCLCLCVYLWVDTLMSHMNFSLLIKRSAVKKNIPIMLLWIWWETGEISSVVTATNKEPLLQTCVEFTPHWKVHTTEERSGYLGLWCCNSDLWTEETSWMRGDRWNVLKPRCWSLSFRIGVRFNSKWPFTEKIGS